MRLFYLHVAMFSTMLSFCNDRTKLSEIPPPLFMVHGISVRRPSLVVHPINVYVDQSFRHEIPICYAHSTSNEGELAQSFSDILYRVGGGLGLLSDSSLYHHRELVSIANNTNHIATYVHVTVISLFAGSYALCWFFIWDMNRNDRLVPQEYKIRVINSYYGVVSFSVLVWIQKVVGTPTDVKDRAWWIELICWAGYLIVLAMTFLIHKPITDSGFLDVAIGVGSSCFIFTYISKWDAVPLYTVVCCLIFIRNHFGDILRVVRPTHQTSPSSKGLPKSVVDVQGHSNRLPALSPSGAGLLESAVRDSRLRTLANQQENNSLLPPLITQQDSNIDPPAIDEQRIDRPLPEITEPVFHSQVINPPSMGGRPHGCNQVAEMEIECGGSLRLLFAEEVAELDIEFGESLRLLFAEEVAEMEIEHRDGFRLQLAEEVVVHTLICSLYAILILAIHVRLHTH